jgi:hypothetical protein
MTAPAARRVDALTGHVANEKFFKALSEADAFVREVDTLRELQCRVDELAAENADLAERLRDLDESHRITLSRLAVADAQLKRMQATR